MCMYIHTSDNNCVYREDGTVLHIALVILLVNMLCMSHLNDLLTIHIGMI